MSAVKARPVWQAVLGLAHRGEISGVCVWSLDRMGRDMLGILQDVRTIRGTGAILVSTREPWMGQTLGAVDDLLLGVLAWAAEFERRRLIERTQASIDEIKQHIATTGTHTTRAGKTIARLGRPNALTPEQRAHLESLAQTAGIHPCISALARIYGVSRATVRAELAKYPTTGHGA
jgi:Site-specific recombinases, DNA invertase Pin homologs